MRHHWIMDMNNLLLCSKTFSRTPQKCPNSTPLTYLFVNANDSLFSPYSGHCCVFAQKNNQQFRKSSPPQMASIWMGVRSSFQSIHTKRTISLSFCPKTHQIRILFRFKRDYLLNLILIRHQISLII